MAVYIALYLVPRYDEMVTGLWCPHCLKPSGYSLELDRITETGVSPRCMTMRKCYDCDAPLQPEGETG